MQGRSSWNPVPSFSLRSAAFHEPLALLDPSVFPGACQVVLEGREDDLPVVGNHIVGPHTRSLSGQSTSPVQAAARPASNILLAARPANCRRMSSSHSTPPRHFESEALARPPWSTGRTHAHARRTPSAAEQA